MATRNLTRNFQNLRRDCKGSRVGNQNAHDEWEQARRTLPPYWVDTVDECRVHIDQISKKSKYIHTHIYIYIYVYVCHLKHKKFSNTQIYINII